MSRSSPLLTHAHSVAALSHRLVVQHMSPTSGSAVFVCKVQSTVTDSVVAAEGVDGHLQLSLSELCATFLLNSASSSLLLLSFTRTASLSSTLMLVVAAREV